MEEEWHKNVAATKKYKQKHSSFHYNICLCVLKCIINFPHIIPKFQRKENIDNYTIIWKGINKNKKKLTFSFQLKEI